MVNLFIEYFWNNPDNCSKAKLLKSIVDIPKDNWLSARLRKVAAREAIDMVTASKKRWSDKAKLPKHRGNKNLILRSQ